MRSEVSRSVLDLLLRSSVAWVVACGAPAQTQPAALPASSSSQLFSSAPPGNGQARAQPAISSAGSAPAGASSSAPDVDLLRDDREPDPKKALPAVSVRPVGMHIGGESNSSESKKPFLRALEATNTQLLFCYRLVDSPLSGGTFGVDLFVALAGGAPDVRGMRHKLGGSEFEACMGRALAGARFDRPDRATVLSYSLRFDVAR